MNLTDEQRQKVASWIHDGLKLAEIQSRLADDLGLRLTYMEVRLLVDDLRLMPKDPPAPPVPPPPPAAGAPKAAGPLAGEEAEDEAEAVEAELMPDPKAGPAGAGKVAVTVDKLAVPGAVVSGKVTFSDGKSAQWYLDDLGRLGIAAKEKGYRPPAQDMQVFQRQLQRELQRMGF